MASLAATRDALVVLLDAIPGLRAYGYVPGDANFPAAVFLPPTIPDYRDDLGAGSLTVTFTVALFVPVTFDRKQLDLYKFLERTGPESVFAAIENNRSLGLPDVDAHAVAVESLEMTEIGGKNCVGAAVTVQVIVGG